MIIHVLQHVSFEDEASIGTWAKDKGHHVTRTLLFNKEKLPDSKDYDLLLVMGGPMSVHDEKEFPFLVPEKAFIRNAILEGKKVLGICLGAQLIAHVLGGAVTKNPEKEIGWFSVRMTEKAVPLRLLQGIPKVFTAFHWHGETFSVPRGAVSIAESDACANQGFVFQDRVLALQFHLESTEESVSRLILKCPGDLVRGKYIENESAMLGKKENFPKINSLMDKLMSNLSRV